MSQLDAVQFDAIEQLTRQYEQHALCAALVEALPQLDGVASANVYEAYDSHGEDASAGIVPERLMLRCCPDPSVLDPPPWFSGWAGDVEANPTSPQLLTSAPPRLVISLGFIGDMWRFVVAETEAPLAPPLQQAVVRLATVFRNQLQLLDRFERDSLTGLFNRQSFDYRLSDLVARHRTNPRRGDRSQRPWVAIADIDHFKTVNDDYGHLFGDRILRVFADLMRESFRLDDLLFRYGGEEFLIVLANTDEAGARRALERFRGRVAEHPFPTIEHLTTSVGWVGVTADDVPSTLVHKADQALYEAKARGRNCVVSFREIFDPPSAVQA